MKPSEQAQVNFIMDCLRKGEQRKDVLAKFVKKWQSASTRTFDRRLKQAEKEVAKEQERIRTEAESNVAEKVKGLESKIMTALERQIYLTQIANCKSDIKKLGNFFYQIIEFEDGRKEFITQADKLKAIQELNKMCGDYAPQRIDATVNKIGKDAIEEKYE